ncbi:MAG: EamA/RhaT family transporter [Gammaproteobacteria bacterium]|nr:MAG: EamA/RhaT family transporter [Gammaproteobacteria bacterium]
MATWIWIPITLFAVVMQTVRTAGQKQLTAHLDPIAVTLVRFLFGLPFAAVYLACVAAWSDASLPPLNGTFVVYTALGGVAQIIATVLLIHLFSLRNFAVGTTSARTEAFLTAFIGALFFGEWISIQGWVAIVISVAGVVVLTIARSHVDSGSVLGRLWNRAAAIGLASGLGFALASLSIRKASLSFGIDDFLLSAGMTLVLMVILQTFIMVVYVAVRSPTQFAIIARQWRVSLFVGLTSALGSIGWFTAMTVERAAYVKALGQVEFLFALVISTLFFRERTTRVELMGMTLVAGGVVILLLAA